MEDYEKKEAEKKVKPASKRKSDIKFVHENGDVSSVGDDTPKKKRGRGDTKEDKEPSPVTPEDSKRGGGAGSGIVFNKDSDDESEHGGGGNTVNVEELIRASDDSDGGEAIGIDW